jgi:hypothetical protein
MAPLRALDYSEEGCLLSTSKRNEISGLEKLRSTRTPRELGGARNWGATFEAPILPGVTPLPIIDFIVIFLSCFSFMSLGRFSILATNGEHFQGRM